VKEISRDRDAPELAEPVTRHAPATGVPAQALQLQRTVGNRATAQLVQRGIGDSIKDLLGMDYERVAKAEGELVRVRNKKEIAEAEMLIRRIEYRYGVDVSSMKSVKATKDAYQSAPATELAKVEVEPWNMRELRAVDRALAHFAPILGGKRAKSSRKDVDQETTSVGKANFSIDEDSAQGVIDPDTLGEFYDTAKNFSIYKPSETSTGDFPGDLDKQLEGTTVHEISHGLMYYAIDRFMAATDGYWRNEDRARKKPPAGAEKPPTKYGRKNAREDLCESMMLFFVDRARLKSTAPKREALIAELVAEWTAGPPVGDFEVPKGTQAMLA
jgi:hypothetical protein